MIAGCTLRARGRAVLAAVSLWIVASPGTPDVAARLAPAEATLTAQAWSLDEAGDVRQIRARIASEREWGAQWQARGELVALRTEGGGAHLGPRLSGSVLLRHRPHARWLLQGGVRAPEPVGDLTEREQRLARIAGEPLLGYPSPTPVRGWRVHAGLAHAYPFAYRWQVTFGLGFDWAGAARVAEGASFRPAWRSRGHAQLQTRWAGYAVRLRGDLVREGEETLDGMRVRAARWLAGLTATAQRHFPTGTAAFALGAEQAGRVAYPDSESYGAWRSAGPGWLLQTRATARLGQPADALRPGAAVAYRRLFPDGLPLGDGWSFAIEPHLTWRSAGGRAELGVAWLTGRVHGGASTWGGGRERMNGVRLRLAWRADGQPAASSASEDGG